MSRDHLSFSSDISAPPYSFAGSTYPSQIGGVYNKALQASIQRSTLEETVWFPVQDWFAQVPNFSEDDKETWAALSHI